MLSLLIFLVNDVIKLFELINKVLNLESHIAINILEVGQLIHESFSLILESSELILNGCDILS